MIHHRQPSLFVVLFLLALDGGEALLGLFSRKVRRVKQFQDLLVGRRTINDFKETLPDNWEDALEQAILAATYAPNHKRTEPWRFHLLGPESIRQICELNAELVAEKRGAAAAGEKKLRRWLAIPGWLVVTCKKDSSDKGSMEDPTSLAREDYGACCCAVQNLCLSLHSNEIGTKWTTGPVNYDERFAKIVGFLPQEEFVVGTIWFGSAAIQPNPPPKKLGVQDVLIRHT